MPPVNIKTIILTFSIVFLAFNYSSAQNIEEETFIEKLFSGYDVNRGLYLGVVNNFEQNTYSLGGEIKWMDFYYYIPVASASAYSSYRYLLPRESLDLPTHCVSAGIHYTFLGLEFNSYFNRDNNFSFYLSPKLGFDLSYLSLFAGLNIPLKSFNRTQDSLIQITLKSSLNIFDADKSRKKKRSPETKESLSDQYIILSSRI